MHWGNRHRWKKAWQEEVWGAYQEWKAKNFNLPHMKNFLKKLPLGKAKMEIYVFTSKAQDYDNCYASMKGVIDGCVQAGIIKDDRMDCVSPKLKVINANRKGEHVELLIWKQ